MKIEKFAILIICILSILNVKNTNAQFQENANMLFNWNDSTIIGSNSFDNAYNEVWGVSINNKDFAFIGSTSGNHIFDVTDKNNVTFSQFFASPFVGGSVIHRDYHDYNGYLYVVCDEGGSSTLQILDISNLPDTIVEVYNSNELFVRAHNIFIDTATAKLFVCSPSTVANGNLPMTVYSLNEPTNPVLLSTYTEPGHVHDVFVRNDTAYCNNGPDGFAMVKFEDDGTYNTLGTLIFYPEQGYNHSGWLTENGQYYVMADETWGTRIKLLDVSDPTDIEVVSLFGSGTTTNSIVHNLIIEGDYVFVSYYYDGLQVFNIADPLNPIKVAQYDTYLQPNNSSYKGAWGVYPNLKKNSVLISDMQTGLYVFELEIEPEVNFTIEENNGEITLTDNSLFEPYLFSWSIDGIGIGGGNILNTNLTDGTYEICLEAFNDAGSNTLCQTITVNTEVGVESFYNNDITIISKENSLNFNYTLPNTKEVNYKIYELNGSLINNYKFAENGNVARKLILNESLKNKFVIVSVETDEATFTKKVWID